MRLSARLSTRLNTRLNTRLSTRLLKRKLRFVLGTVSGAVNFMSSCYIGYVKFLYKSGANSGASSGEGIKPDPTPDPKESGEFILCLAKRHFPSEPVSLTAKEQYVLYLEYLRHLDGNGEAAYGIFLHHYADDNLLDGEYVAELVYIISTTYEPPVAHLLLKALKFGHKANVEANVEAGVEGEVEADI